MTALLLACCASVLADPQPVFPGKEWARKTPIEVGLDGRKLATFHKAIGGSGCIVRFGYLADSWGDATKSGDIASAAKPVYAHFLWKALADKKIADMDETVSRYETRLKELNKPLGFKDRGITWRHLATQTSCYGVTEAPGKAYDYSDWQMALFWDLLFGKVYKMTPQTVDEKLVGPQIAKALGCQDRVTMRAIKGTQKIGRMGFSPRDFARFGLLYLRQGQWHGKQVLPREMARKAVTSPLPANLPRTSGKKADMLPNQRSIGGGNNQTDHGGSYSYLWWVNGVDRHGKRMWPSLPRDSFAALGHGGKRGLLVVPSLDLIVSWNDSRIDGRDGQDRILKLVVEAVRRAKKD